MPSSEQEQSIVIPLGKLYTVVGLIALLVSLIVSMGSGYATYSAQSASQQVINKNFTEDIASIKEANRSKEINDRQVIGDLGEIKGELRAVRDMLKDFVRSEDRRR